MLCGCGWPGRGDLIIFKGGMGSILFRLDRCEFSCGGERPDFYFPLGFKVREAAGDYPYFFLVFDFDFGDKGGGLI